MKERTLSRGLFNRHNGHDAEIKTKHILLPIKGEPAIDEEAMRLAYTYALAKMDKGRNVSVDVVYVVQVPHALALDADLPEEVEKGEKALNHAETIAQSMNLGVEMSLIHARSAGAAIVEMSRKAGSELIVMATDYTKRLGELDLGHTIPYVLKHAPCRVWICRGSMDECAS